MRSMLCFKGHFRWVHLDGALDAVDQPVYRDGIGIIPAKFSLALISH
jgi:putative flavoprotein involved in K+ transport